MSDIDPFVTGSPDSFTFDISGGNEGFGDFAAGLLRQIPILGDALAYSDQIEQRDYARGLQQEMFRREDTAVQRRVADLKAAGLSPVLAAGQGARAGPVIGSNAPVPSSQKLETALSLMRTKADVSRTAAQNRLLSAQVKNVDAQTAKVQQDTHFAGIERPLGIQWTEQTLKARVRTIVELREQAEINTAIRELDHLIRTDESEVSFARSSVGILESQMRNAWLQNEPYLNWKDPWTGVVTRIPLEGLRNDSHFQLLLRSLQLELLRAEKKWLPVRSLSNIAGSILGQIVPGLSFRMAK